MGVVTFHSPTERERREGANLLVSLVQLGHGTTLANDGFELVLQQGFYELVNNAVYKT